MSIKYLCIDDDDKEQLEPQLKLLKSENQEFEFECQKPLKDIGEQIERIKQNYPDGFILDLRLDRKANDEGKIVPHRGQTLAQELRSHMATAEDLPPRPIILWTVQDNIPEFERDDTAHDLYDLKYIKDKEILHSPDVVVNELLALSEGYRYIKSQIAEEKFFHRLINLSEEEVNTLDPRIGDSFASNRKNGSATHEVSRGILQDLIFRPGPLIDENLLAARLGVDIQNSADWPKILEQLSEKSKYSGVFREGWPRWWAYKVENWWGELDGCPAPLRRLTAGERVNFLTQYSALEKLVPADPIGKNYSTRYWCLCMASNRPLDPIDGFMASCPNLKPWQDTPYLSIDSIVDFTAKHKGFRVDPLERDRLEDTLESIKGK